MPFLNKTLKLKFRSRYQAIDFFKENPSLSQERVFFDLLNRAQSTAWGRKHAYTEIIKEGNYSQALTAFKSKIPISTYENLYPEINLACQGKKNILWPGRVKWVAKSSGTTNDKSKIIPLSRDSLQLCHYQGGEDVLAFYIKDKPEARLFFGKTLSVGGSLSSYPKNRDLFCGDLSAILINNLPWWARIFRFPRTSTALLPDWEIKVEAIAKKALKQNIVALAGVPSWTLVVLNKILELSGKNDISDVWPNLELFIHGGVSFHPYQQEFDKIIVKNKINYLETYNASEGFFAANDDLSRDDMLLFLDNGIFYEFIPLEELDKNDPLSLGVEDLELGKVYALAISTNGGLWRYLIGDTVKITSLKPLRIKVAGRTKHFINVFGEELMVSNTDQALALASQASGASVSEYTVAPIFMQEGSGGGHEWLIEFFTPPTDLNFFTRELDDNLKKLNSDYEAKRYNDIILSLPKINVARSGLFYDWLKKKNKLGGQNKVPRLSNSREYLESLMKEQ